MSVLELRGWLDRHVDVRHNWHAVDARASGGYTPLHLSARHDRVKVVKLLLLHGADPQAREGGGWTPVHRAAAEGHADIVRVLLANGAETDAANDQGDTPLEYALIGEHDEAIRLLLERGARVESDKGMTPLTVTGSAPPTLR